MWLSPVIDSQGRRGGQTIGQGHGGMGAGVVAPPAAGVRVVTREIFLQI